MDSANADNLKRIFDEVGYPVFVIKDYRFTYANKAFAKLVGKKNLALKCSKVLTCYGEASSNCSYHEVCKTKKSLQSVIPFHKKGKEYWFALEFSPLKKKDGSIEGVLATARDISKFVDIENEIIKTNSELTTINRIASSLSQLDLDKLLKEVLDKVTRVLNVNVGAVHLCEAGELRCKAHKGISKEFAKAVSVLKDKNDVVVKCSKQKEAIYIKNVQKRKSVTKIHELLEKEKITSHLSVPLLASGKLMGVLTLGSNKVRSFSEHEVNLISTMASQIGVAINNARLYKRTKELARTDLLTGLFNFKHFEEILKKEIKRSGRNNLNFSVLIIDIDNLASVNDFYGHESGDRIIKQFGNILKANLRKSDYIARYAGDEFIILLPETELLKAKMVAEKIRKKATKIRLFGFDKKQMVTVSIGIAVYPVSGTTSSAMVKSADLAMCQSKQGGKDQTCIYDPSFLSIIGFDNHKIERFAQDADLSTIQTLVTAVDLKDNYTQQHSSEVSRLSVCLAQAMGASEEDLEKLRIAGLLHDIGKIGVADSILLKQGPLSNEEFVIIKKHPTYSVNILKHSKHFTETLPIILHHHERFDGTGYPKGLKRFQIPYLSRIISICDAYQAMVSDRPYRKGLSKRAAIDELKRCAGTQFDADMVKVFISILSRVETSARPSTSA